MVLDRVRTLALGLVASMRLYWVSIYVAGTKEGFRPNPSYQMYRKLFLCGSRISYSPLMVMLERGSQSGQDLGLRPRCFEANFSGLKMCHSTWGKGGDFSTDEQRQGAFLCAEAASPTALFWSFQNKATILRSRILAFGLVVSM